MSNLQTLSFEYCDNLEVLIGEVKLASLEALIVRSICSLSELEVLLVIDCKRLELNLPENLQNTTKRWRINFLHVENFPRLQIFPKWIEDAAETLQTIENAAETLQTLIITNIPMLSMLPACLTRMTRLKILHISGCPGLNFQPRDMQCLTSLEALTIDGCPVLCQKCQPHSGEYWPMISHIKRVSIGEPKEEEPREGQGSLISNDDIRYFTEPEEEPLRSLFINADLLPYLWYELVMEEGWSYEARVRYDINKG